MRSFRDELPWGFLAEDIFLGGRIGEEVCWIGLTEAEL